MALCTFSFATRSRVPCPPVLPAHWLLALHRRQILPAERHKVRPELSYPRRILSPGGFRPIRFGVGLNSKRLRAGNGLAARLMSARLTPSLDGARN